MVLLGCGVGAGVEGGGVVVSSGAGVVSSTISSLRKGNSFARVRASRKQRHNHNEPTATKTNSIIQMCTYHSQSTRLRVWCPKKKDEKTIETHGTGVVVGSGVDGGGVVGAGVLMSTHSVDP
jgi:hypothetical protein